MASAAGFKTPPKGFRCELRTGGASVTVTTAPCAESQRSHRNRSRSRSVCRCTSQVPLKPKLTATAFIDRKPTLRWPSLCSQRLSPSGTSSPILVTSQGQTNLDRHSCGCGKPPPQLSVSTPLGPTNCRPSGTLSAPIWPLGEFSVVQNDYCFPGSCVGGLSDSPAPSCCLQADNPSTKERTANTTQPFTFTRASFDRYVGKCCLSLSLSSLHGNPH